MSAKKQSSSDFPIADIILYFLSDLRKNWKPKTKTKTSHGYHGSSKGKKIEYTLYFDEFRCEWTTKERAFQGLAFKKIDEFIKH